MVYNKYENTVVTDDFELWFDELTGQNAHKIIDDILPDVLGSGYHEYNGIHPDWRFSHTGRAIF